MSIVYIFEVIREEDDYYVVKCIGTERILECGIFYNLHKAHISKNDEKIIKIFKI